MNNVSNINNINNINNDNTIKNDSMYISNLFELKKICDEIYEYKAKLESISDDKTIDAYERKIKLTRINENITKLCSKLDKGMHINCDDFKTKIIFNIMKYLNNCQINVDLLYKKLNNVTFFVSDIMLSSGGKLVSFSDKIGIDYRYINFDENGNIIGFKEEYTDFLVYTITHEFLHFCSLTCSSKYNDNSKTVVSNDGLSEGLTDMFAHIISNNNKDKSERYDFLVRVCTLLAKLVGIDNLLDDYINNLDVYPNLQKLFMDCGLNLEEFFKFKALMNKINEKNNLNDVNLKIELINYLKDNIFTTIVSTMENKDEYINLFNNLFGQYGVFSSLDQIAITK